MLPTQITLFLIRILKENFNDIDSEKDSTEAKKLFLK